LESIEVGGEEFEQKVQDRQQAEKREGNSLGGKERLRGPLSIRKGMSLDVICPTFGTMQADLDSSIKLLREGIARTMVRAKLGTRY